MPSLLDAPSAPTFTPDQLAKQRVFLIGSKANGLIQAPRTLFDTLLKSWENGVAAIWDDPNPSDILAALGTHGVELFQLSSKTAEFLESLQPGCTAGSMAKVKDITANPDGSIQLA